MKRRDLLKLGIGTATLAAIPSCTSGSAAEMSQADRFEVGRLETAKNHGCAPRRVELLDFDWRFKRAAHFSNPKNAVSIHTWFWKQGTPDQVAEMTAMHVDTTGHGWHKVDTKFQGMPVGYAWYRTTLPPMNHAGRAIEFTHVDDNGSIYLNGHFIQSHQGWDLKFYVPLDDHWNPNGPNILTVLVNNTSGPGGIYGPVLAGYMPAELAAYAPQTNDSSWQKVQLPHDYIVEGKYSRAAVRGHGSLPVYPAWYRRHIHIPAADAGKSLWLYFEGVYRDAKIYLNGKLISEHPGGYTSFHVDISDHVAFGHDNLLAVYVDPTNFEGWWYEGGGIYRHVWLNVADRVHVAPWGVYVTSNVQAVETNPSATLSIQTTVANHTAASKRCGVVSKVYDPTGQLVGTVSTEIDVPPVGPMILPAVQKAVLESDASNIDQPSDLHLGTKLIQELHLPSVLLWSLEHTHRYHVETEILSDGNVVDRHKQKFGIRTLRFDPDAGFFLNEQPVKIQGTCNHQDFAGVGIGLPDSILFYRMKRLKEFGCNAIRCSHNPMAPSMYDACDELGLLVMDENRHPGSTIATKSWVGQPYHNVWHVESLVLRDRNHPSIIMWSMWNEEWNIQSDAYGRKMMAFLMEVVHRHDETRPITCADNHGLGKHGWLHGDGAAESILGVNYNYGDFDWLHHAYPDKMIFGSEIGSNLECRGIYHTNKKAGHLTSYMSPEGSWHPLATRRFVAGGFYWTGFDYRGETAPFGWPEINSNFGFLDMCGFPKDGAYYWKSVWMPDTPVLHIFPHWNWPGMEGKNIPVWCFSNCQYVELLLNGKSLGKKRMAAFRHLQWNRVLYTPGHLEARGYNNGVLVATTMVATTGAPAAIRLTPDRRSMIADGQDTVPIAVSIVDKLGRVVPTAANMVSFSLQGPGVISGVGNGDPSCLEPNQANYRSAFNGLCMALVRADRHAGSLTLMARSPGLTPAQVTLPALPA